jgi:hypothetical protein
VQAEGASRAGRQEITAFAITLSIERAHLMTANLLVFHCPGCEYGHNVSVNCAGSWEWNGSLELPTISPSILVWKDRPEARCHSFVRDGKIQFLADCFHALAGQTVDLPDWDS